MFISMLAVSSLIMAKPANAQSIPTPSVPEFSLEYVNTSYFSSPITTTDPYTGQTQSYRNSITERGIIVTIKNQPFTQPLDNNGFLEVNQSCLFYLFQWKGHYSTTWTNSSQNSLYQDSNSSYTVLRIPLNGNNDSRFSSPIELEGLTDGGKLDFQVQAFIGYYKYIPTPTQLNPFYPTSTAVFVGQSSGWSGTQTIDIINGSTTTSIGTDAVVVSLIIGVVVAVGAGLLFYFKKRKH
jgi:LPXTG-motif cell wall-anchored protein